MILTIADAIAQVAEEAGKTFAQISLNWVLSRPGVCTAIFAARTEVQLHDNLGAIGWTLTPQQIDVPDRASEQNPGDPCGHQHQFPTLNPTPAPYDDIKKS